MPKVHHVKKARKAHREYGIKKGESYYWWKFRRGGKRVSKTYPKPWELTRSEYLATILRLEGEMPSASDRVEDLEALADYLDNAESEVRTLGEEQEEKRSNMPDSLQDGEVGQLLETRSERCSELSDQLDDAAQEIRDLIERVNAGEEDDLDAESEAQSALDNIDWTAE